MNKQVQYWASPRGGGGDGDGDGDGRGGLEGDSTSVCVGINLQLAWRFAHTDIISVSYMPWIMESPGHMTFIHCVMACDH